MSPLDVVWLYVRVQLFVFLCGIVGPIFLFVFFAAQPDPAIKWMYYAGLIALGLTARAVESPDHALAKRFSS